jgi:GT2 family glycosyltransferase
VRVHVVTVAAGRHEHLRLQLDGLRRGDRRPDGHIVVAMSDPEIRDVCGRDAAVIECSTDEGRLPVARARNAGAAAALARGAELIVFLDVDCIPGSSLLSCYVAAAEALTTPALLSGPVTYLPPPPPAGYDLAALDEMTDPHPDRPMPGAGTLADLDHNLFWSLSFATTPGTWAAIGGFCEEYAGYGAEDTDFGQAARKAGVPHLAVGGAHAYHQWHPSGDPPLQHLEDIVRNGRIFRDRWGWWPMAGWLHKFAELDLVHYDADSDDWRLPRIPSPPRPHR